MDPQDLREKWHREVHKASARYAMAMEGALDGPVPVWEQAILRHQRAIKRLRKMIRKANSKRKERRHEKVDKVQS